MNPYALRSAVGELLEGLELEAVHVEWETEEVPSIDVPSGVVAVEHRRTGVVTLTIKGRSS